jgi:beta-N-acetylhexosaminidase
MCAGQVLVAGFGAGEPPNALLRMAAAGSLGGFILFRRNLGAPAEVAELAWRLHDSVPSELPAWLGVDQEGGRVARLGAPVLRLPPMRALGDIDDAALSFECAARLGRQLRVLGFNLNFAPVLDVDTNPANPVIGDRSFGRTPERVIRHGRAFAGGLAEAGIAACGKHFPGHGDTAQDSHLDLPRLPHPRSRLDQVELAPFAALAASLPCIMTAHVIFEAIDRQVPATLSPAVIDVLRSELQYRGVVISDDLEMKAISDHHELGEAACAAIAAGCDSLLVCSNVEQLQRAHEALLHRAQREPDFAARLRAAAERSLSVRLRHRAQPAAPARVEQLLALACPAELEERIALAQHAAIAPQA